jgi:26S proteasome regulatory subunit N1
LALLTILLVNPLFLIVLAKYIILCVEGCAYAGSGNVLKIQKMMHECVIPKDKEKTQAQDYAQSAVIAIALIS